jgi:predicted ABC-type ATPase
LKKPILLVIAGPNGAGKTTLTGRLNIERYSNNAEYLNADEVAREQFGDWNNPEDVLAAARWVTTRREQLLSERQSIALETVFSTYEKLDFLDRAKRSGYFIRVFFVGVDDPRLLAARIAGRVIDGGQTVPIEKIIRRYPRAMANLPRAIEIVDRVYIYDNSVDGVEAQLYARTANGKLRRSYSDDPPAWVAGVIDQLPRHGDLMRDDDD